MDEYHRMNEYHRNLMRQYLQGNNGIFSSFSSGFNMARGVATNADLASLGNIYQQSKTESNSNQDNLLLLLEDLP